MREVLGFAISSFLLMMYSLSFVFLGGYVISLLEDKANLYLQRAFGYTGLVVTGFGTVIHELSHYIMCLIGFIKVTDVRLFRPIKGRLDGVLGYVSYDTNSTKKWYSKMFLLFVGIAPIIGGTIAILISMRFLLPNAFSMVSNGIKTSPTLDVFSIDFLKYQLNLVFLFFKELVTVHNILTIQFWIFIFIVISIASHMSLSKADVISSIKSIPIMFVFSVILAFCLNIIGIGFNEIEAIMGYINIYSVTFLSISLVFSILNFIICIVLQKLKCLIK